MSCSSQPAAAGKPYSLHCFRHLCSGDHLCGLFGTNEEQITAVTQFIRDGITHNDKIIYICDEQEILDGVLDSLKKNPDIDLEAILQTKQLHLSKSYESYTAKGFFDPDAMLEDWVGIEKAAIAEGYTHLRITAEPTWVRAKTPRGYDRFLEYESKINTFFHSTPHSLAMCMYNINRWTSQHLLDILTTHPLGLINLELYHNFYYIPPQDLVANDIPTTTLKHWISNLRDRKRMEEALIAAKEQAVQASNAKSQFLATVSHEIRTPINGVIGMTEVLSQMELSSEQRECVDVIKASGVHLLTVINDVLDSARIESGKVELENEPIEVRTLVKEAMIMCQSSAASKGLLLCSEISADCPSWVLGDPTRLRQVIINLVSNAVKFSHEGSVTIAVKVTGSPYDTPKEPMDMPCIAYPPDTTPVLGENGLVLQFSVKDEGIGVPANRLGAIFDTFTQVDHSTTRVYGGTGLGLAICKQIVQLMGGTISVRSKQGVGSIFSFTLPTHQYTLPTCSAPETPTASPKIERVQPIAPEKSTNGSVSEIAELNVLVAEDNVINQKVIGKMLSNLGCKFNVVSDGAEAITACKQTQYDVVLMDLHMPNIDGWKAAEIIKQQPTHPIVFATTAALFHEADYERLKTCMDGYLVKPVSLVRVKQLLLDVATKHPYPRWT